MRHFLSHSFISLTLPAFGSGFFQMLILEAIFFFHYISFLICPRDSFTWRLAKIAFIGKPAFFCNSKLVKGMEYWCGMVEKERVIEASGLCQGLTNRFQRFTHHPYNLQMKKSSHSLLSLSPGDFHPQFCSLSDFHFPLLFFWKSPVT